MEAQLAMLVWHKVCNDRTRDRAKPTFLDRSGSAKPYIMGYESVTNMPSKMHEEMNE